ncbi:MAG: TolC family protein [Saprospiraceae bacterium]|nr:TolC family protein [Saprospiraceae bacterium]MCF8248675.1 TolC family protein [Saprospiraceae bacterium]MCF8278835.1 TolC family protein [Bacteroidales bacterium]MCF8310635.1 TolC family protein [Saprospiraceae bacterium]MCF8439194.1 TolC family protein [Saprospiraceae bacterium]
MQLTIRFFLFPALLLSWFPILGQNAVTLQDCYHLAEANTAIAQNPQLFEKITVLKLENIDASRLPTVQWNAKATWQNEVFGLPFSFPGVDFNIPKYNVLTNLEANYVLLDGGFSEAKKTIEKAKLAVDNQSVTVELNKLREQVDRFFFGAALLQTQTKMLELTQKDLAAKAAQLEAAVRHGVALESEVLKLQVEQLKVQSKIEEIGSDRRALLSVLSSLLGQTLDENSKLELPNPQSAIQNPQSNRPELALFDLQKAQVLASADLIGAQWNPKVAAFAITGVGYPDPLNFFDDKISPYFIGGVQFSWKFLDWKQADRERQQLSVQLQLIENQKQTFTQNLEHQDGKFREDIAKLQNQIQRDEEIAKLQAEILKQLSSQLDNGVATATDYLLQSDAELQARLAMEAHRVQLVQVEAAWRTWKGVGIGN